MTLAKLRPMLACPVPSDLDKLRFPVLASPKLDGWRCLVRNGTALTRTLKPIRNKHIQSLLGQSVYNGLDGEIIVGSPTDPNCIRNTTSGCSSIEGEPDFTFHIFDNWNRGFGSFKDCHDALRMSCHDLPLVKVHPHEELQTVSQLESFESACIEAGFEGVIVRDPDAPYKFGRSTEKQQWMLKMKRFVDAEAIITEVEQGTRNLNEATTNNLGYTERSSAQDGKVPDEIVGALHGFLLDPETSRPTAIPITVGIFKGVTKDELRIWWANRANLLEQIMKVSFLPYGMLNKPRHAKFIGFRAKEDLG